MLKLGNSHDPVETLGRLLMLLLVVIVSVRGSCDGIFSYTRRDDGTYYGRLRIARPQFYNGGNFEVNLKMSVNKILPQGIPMGVDLEGSANEAEQLLRQARPLFYSVRLPSQNPLPRVRQVQVNGRNICQENPNLRGSVTQIGLQHTLKLHAGAGVPIPPSRLPWQQGPRPSEQRQASGGCQMLYSRLRNGVVQLRVPPSSTRSPGDAVTVKVHAATPNQGNLKSPILKLEESLDVVAERLRAGSNEPIKFIYTMPASTTHLTAVEVNGQYICHEQHDNKNGVAVTSVSNSVFPFGSGQPAETPYSSRTTQSPPTSSTPRLPNEGDCGSVNMRNQLVLLGKNVSHGDWPWLAAIYVNYNTGIGFICGGSLVTLRHVISAAHCTYEKDQDEELEEEDITVILGMHKVGDFSARTQTMHVKKIIRHPSYVHKSKTDADIVIFELSNAAEKSNWVRPVCAWGSANTNLVGHTGMVVGWGMDEMGPQTSLPRSAAVPVVSRDTCRMSHDHFRTGITENNFCAGNRDGRGPCNGDSGGGLFFLEPGPSGERWVLRGVVSFSLSDNRKRCDLSHYVAYADVTKLAAWLSRYIN